MKAAKSYGANNLDNEATFYLDKNGYIVAVGNVAENAYNYALVLAAGTSIDERVKVALPDGTTGTYVLNTNGNGLKLSGITVGKVYAYSINSNKEIKLTAATTDGNTYTNAAFTKGKTTISGSAMTSVYANKNTVFFYTPGLSSDGKTVSDVDVYAGYDKAPTLDGASRATVQVYTSGTRVVAVVFTGSNLTTANVSDNLYISSVGTSTSNYTNAKAFLAGDTKLTDIKVSGSVKSGTAYTYSVNSDGYYELKAVPAGNSIADATVYLSNSSTVVFDKSGTKTELKITSKTLLVNHSEYLSDPVAELGAGPDVGDKITSVIYNGDDEALLIVIKNAEQKKDEDVVVKDYTKVTDKGGDLTIDHYQDSLSTAEIQSVLKTWAKADSVKYNAKDKTATFVGGSYDGNTLKVVLNKVVNITVGGTNQYVDDATKLNELGLDGKYAKVTANGGAEEYKEINTDTVADGSKYEGGFYKVTVDGTKTTVSNLDNATVEWVAGGKKVTENTAVYLKKDDTVVATVSLGTTGFQTGKADATLVGSGTVTPVAKITTDTNAPSGSDKATVSGATITFPSNTQTYKDGVFTFTWTVTDKDIDSMVLTMTNA